MKQTKYPLPILLVIVLITLGNTLSSAVIIPAITSVENIGNSSHAAYEKASVFVTLTSKEFEKARGQKLTLLEKLYFKTSQRKLRKELKNDPALTIDTYYDVKTAKFKLDGLWFLLGAMIGPLAILFSFTSKQKKNFRKSAALGTIVFLIWFGYLFLF